ncbi:MAG: DUF3025 domain-containing protein [Burkholderiaceae bacterium]|nr:DUF3025 domain-containing protein [Burkholderiaceae bacterium]
MEACTVNAGAIDWSAPWLAPLVRWREVLQAPDWRVAASGAARAHGVTSGRGRPIVFVAADDAGNTPYELHIANTGRVPARDNWHDAFNALMWLAFPRTKAALNARQADEIERLGIGPRRGAVRDAATLIDESGLLLASDDDSIFDALAQHDWSQLLINGRARWGQDIRAFVFGHALLEKLCSPFKAITACVVPVPLSSEPDEAAARFVMRADLAPARLAHLPVLGIPGWWPPNEDPRFYEDPTVFRLRRSGCRRQPARLLPEG